MLENTMILSPTAVRAVDYIIANLVEDIGVEDVARYCGYSKYYFCRLFKAETGQSVYSFIRRMRIERCAFRLKTEQGSSITDIGIDYGYSSSNFSTLFHELEHETPYYFRKGAAKRAVEHPFFHAEQNRLESFEECAAKIEIENLPDYHVLFERHIGNYHGLSADWCLFLKKYESLHRKESLLFECTYDDPCISECDACIYDLCMEAPQNCGLPNIRTLTGGKFAVYHFMGPHTGIFAAFQSIFTVWLPQSGIRIDERLIFDIYRRVNSDASFMAIDFCLPII